MTAPALRPLTFALLRQLSHGEFESGQALARQFGVSRATVHNALQGVEQLGLSLYRIPRRGYRLPVPPEWLETQRLQIELGTLSSRFHLQLMDSATSSNTLLLRQSSQGAPSATVLAVEWQEAGKGRLGRPWHAGIGNALTFSLLWRFTHGISALSGLSLAVGVGVMRALHQLGFRDVSLKWPNDLLGKEQAKLGGILLEAQGDMLGPSAVVIGIGLNLNMPECVRQHIDQPTSCLAEFGAALPGRNRLLALILTHLSEVLDRFDATGLAPFLTEWTALHAGQNRQVQLSVPSGAMIHGQALGITGEGALRLMTPEGERTFNSGEVSLRWV